MKLLTLNCHSWQEDNQLEKIKYLAKVINEKKYDVIALQEVSQLIDSETYSGNLKKDNFAVILKNLLNEYDFHWDYSHIGYDKYEEGLAIFTKHKIINKKSFFITKSDNINYWKTRKVVKVTIDYKGKNLDLYSCHLGWWKDEEETFKYQVDKLIKTINTNTLTFFMGDFNNNAFIRGEGYDYLLNSGLIDTFNLSKEVDCGITAKGKIDGWDKNKEELRLDLIFSNKSVNVISSKVIFNGQNKEIISDHYGVEVTLEI
ncbi:endonuclease/exonuclease/phosphatase family protein [Clostridium uliginosum]|uniref:Maltose 6'-phosphate phosphatase n=1 Tax=Clostridium uliginosum TaxID=119641 RepID=A0A1I1MF95_9CLOT|nr:endonuclease/exonuclease/phosphatase family protein [Clostridium uliginosum]SFC83492.1 maltose 6'-phosphate phosphatase [Clostridium uliginosum]